MYKSVLALAMLLATASAAQALSPKAEAFLREAGLDPASDAVRLAESDFKGTPIPETDFDRLYLTVTEQRLIRRKIADLPEALPRETKEYLKSIGLDPESDDVFIAEVDGKVETTNLDKPVSYSLDSLAREKKRLPLIRFVTTRAFIRNLRDYFDDAQIPKKNFDPSFLTDKEKLLLEKKVASEKK